MIVRNVLPAEAGAAVARDAIEHFDYFNDYADTSGWLRGQPYSTRRDETLLLLAEGYTRWLGKTVAARNTPPKITTVLDELTRLNKVITDGNEAIRLAERLKDKGRWQPGWDAELEALRLKTVAAIMERDALERRVRGDQTFRADSVVFVTRHEFNEIGKILGGVDDSGRIQDETMDRKRKEARAAILKILELSEAERAIVRAALVEAFEAGRTAGPGGVAPPVYGNLLARLQRMASALNPSSSG